MPRTPALPPGFALLLVLASLNLRPAITSLSPMLPEIQAGYGLGPTGAVLLIALPVAVLGLGAPMSPWLIRHLGQGRAVLAGLIILSLGLLARAVWPAVLFPATIAAAVGITVVAVALPSLIKAVDPLRGGWWTAVYGLAMAAGAAVAPAVSGFLSGAGVAVPVSMGVWAALALLATAAWLWPRWARAERPVAAPGAAVSPWRMLGVRAVQGLALYFALQSLLFFSLVAFLAQYARETGTAPEIAGLLLALFSTIAMAGSWFAPQIAVRLGDARRMSVVLAAVSTVGLAVLVLGGPVVVAVVLLGIGQGSIFPLALTLFVVRSPDSPTAAAVSMVAQGLGFVGSATGLMALAFGHGRIPEWAPLWGVLLVVAVVQAAVGWRAAAPHQVPALASR